MRKDRDLMSDTGGTGGKKRDLQKPSRSQGRGKAKKRALRSDPDFADTMNDPDLKLASDRDIAEMLVNIATEMLDDAEEEGDVYL